MGKDVPQDREAAWYWLERSANQGNQYAEFFLNRFDQAVVQPSTLLSATTGCSTT